AFIAGSEFADSGIILRLLAWALIGVFFGTLYGHAVVAVNKQKLMLFGYAATAVLSVAGYLWMIPRFGMTGAAFVTIFSESLIAILTFSIVWREIRMRLPFVILLKASAAAIMMAYALKMLPAMPVLAAMAIGAVIYAILLLAVGGISVQTIRELMPSRLAAHKKI
ncbi:MAG: Polysaccharide biosynthesis protein, partial [Candidatus Giovannonibacteria bacterium GW2011_GWA2_53_7]